MYLLFFNDSKQHSLVFFIFTYFFFVHLFCSFLNQNERSVYVLRFLCQVGTRVLCVCVFFFFPEFEISVDSFYLV